MGSPSAPMPEIRGRRRAGISDSVGGFESSMVKEPYQSLVATNRGPGRRSPGRSSRNSAGLFRRTSGAGATRSSWRGSPSWASPSIRESLRRDASSHPSAEELADPYAKRYRLRTKGWDFERIRIALTLLWERWLPERPSLEALDEQMITGYTRLEEDDVTGAVESWLEAWAVFLRIFDETRTLSLAEFDDVFGLSELVQNWVGDVEMHLWNAGLRHERFFRSGIGLVNEYLARFEAEDELTTENMRRALASFHVRLGDLAKADALFEPWLTRDPRWGGAGSDGRDAYSLDAPVKDIERAESLLLRGLAVPDVRDEIDLLDRLETLYEDDGREDDERAPRCRRRRHRGPYLRERRGLRSRVSDPQREDGHRDDHLCACPPGQPWRSVVGRLSRVLQQIQECSGRYDAHALDLSKNPAGAGRRTR